MANAKLDVLGKIKARKEKAAVTDEVIDSIDELTETIDWNKLYSLAELYEISVPSKGEDWSGFFSELQQKTGKFYKILDDKKKKKKKKNKKDKV